MRWSCPISAGPRRSAKSARVATKLMGRKTRAVFDRYRIASPGDLQTVPRKLAAAPLTRESTAHSD